MKKRKNNQGPARMDLLSRKELRILMLYGRGYSTREIAGRYDNSPKTIDTYKERTIQKLRIKTSTYPKLAFKLAAGLIS